MKDVKTTYQHAFQWAERERVKLGCRAAPANIVGSGYPDEFYLKEVNAL